MLLGNAPMGANLVPQRRRNISRLGPSSNCYIPQRCVWRCHARQPYRSGSASRQHRRLLDRLCRIGPKGDLYKFWVDGTGSSGFKRDPYARELATDAAFPNCSSIIRSASAYPWHDSSFVTPDFSDMIVYQLHIGTLCVREARKFIHLPRCGGKFPYLAHLGVNILQPLPVDEVEVEPSLGYNGADFIFP